VSAVTDLAAAVRDALTLPDAVGPDAWSERGHIASMRAAYLRGALDALASGDESAAGGTIAAVREAAEWHPVTYPVRDEQPGGGS
jgi:hypothetical protein